MFKISSTGKLTTLHTFEGLDGAYPRGALIEGSDGNFYGTTYFGGRVSSRTVLLASGTVFQISPTGALRTIYKFSCNETTCPDGYGPTTLVQGNDGNLYGTTSPGEYGFEGAPDGVYGTVFKISGQEMLATLHTFNLVDGDDPHALIQGSDGTFYGATRGGGLQKFGTLFSITPEGDLTTLYNFCAKPQSVQDLCPDGAGPGGLFQATDGKFYGTTYTGGPPNAGGTVFSLDVGLVPFVGFVRAAGKVGQAIGILGQGFAGTTSVLLGGMPLTFTVVSDTFIRATVPAGANTGYVTVTTPSGTLKSNVPFRVIP